MDMQTPENMRQDESSFDKIEYFMRSQADTNREVAESMKKLDETVSNVLSQLVALSERLDRREHRRSSPARSISGPPQVNAVTQVNDALAPPQVIETGPPSPPGPPSCPGPCSGVDEASDTTSDAGQIDDLRPLDTVTDKFCVNDDLNPSVDNLTQLTPPVDFVPLDLGAPSSSTPSSSAPIPSSPPVAMLLATTVKIMRESMPAVAMPRMPSLPDLVTVCADAPLNFGHASAGTMLHDLARRVWHPGLPLVAYKRFKCSLAAR